MHVAVSKFRGEGFRINLCRREDRNYELLCETKDMNAIRDSMYCHFSSEVAGAIMVAVAFIYILDDTLGLKRVELSMSKDLKEARVIESAFNDGEEEE